MESNTDSEREEKTFASLESVDASTFQLYNEPQEAALHSDDGQIFKPRNTEELQGMLEKAGTELTVKYITGAISFEEFSRELHKSKCDSEESPTPGTSQQQESLDMSAIPNFELLMEQDYIGDEEESENEDEGDEADMEGDDPDEDWLAEDDGYVDDGEVVDNKDKEWTPKGKMKKEKETKPKRKEKGAAVPKGQRRRKYEPKETSRKRKVRKPRRKMYDIPRILASTYGRAMLLHAQGNVEMAMELFYKIVKDAPKAAAPYESLGTIMEERGNIRQAIKFYMLAANLRGKDSKEWLDICDMCQKLNDEKLIKTCFQKGLSAAKTNEQKLKVLSKRLTYQLERDQRDIALQTRLHMLQYLDRTDMSTTLAFARDLVQDYLDIKDEGGAISTLLCMTKEFPHDIDSEDVHNLVELLMGHTNYIKAIEILVKTCGATITFSPGPTSQAGINKMLQDFLDKKVSLERLEFRSEMPIDLRSKLLQSFILTKVLPNLAVLKDLVNSISSMDAEDYGDVHYDIAETMVMGGYHETAKPILEALVRSDKYNEAAVWQTLGQCLNAQGDLRASIKAYRRVVDMAPGHRSARVTLASLLQQMGQNDVALEVLSHETDEENDRKGQELSMHKCQLLYSQNKMEEFVSAALRLLSFNLPRQFKPEHVRSLMSMKTVKSRRCAKFIPNRGFEHSLKEAEGYIETAGGESNQDQFESVTKGMSGSEIIKFRSNFWDIFIKLIYTLKEKGVESKLLETVTLGVSCPVFTSDFDLSKDAEFLCMQVGPVDKNIYHIARNTIYESLNQGVGNYQLWNLYNYIITRLKGLSMDLRFTPRCLMKNPESLPLSLLNGNERMNAGTYIQAIAEYLAVFKKDPENDMAVLCAALCLLHIASSPRMIKKNTLIMQMTGLFAAYREMRGECQETFYNIGRAWAQLNIQFVAVHYFKKALECPPMVGERGGTFDLSQEIAYNLSRLYLRCNNVNYARYYIEKYCVI